MSDLQLDPPKVPAGTSPTPQFAAASQPSYARTLFLGSDGLRPGWGLAFYALTFFVLQNFTSDLAWSRNFGAGGLWSRLIEEFGDLAAATIPALILARVEGRPWGAYGLPRARAFGKLFWLGTLWGFAAISALIFSLYELHCFHFGHVVLHGARLARFALFWAAMFLLVALFEDFLFRVHCCAFLHFRVRPLSQRRGTLDRPAGCGLHRIFLLPHVAPYRQSVVRRRIPCRVGLGRNLFLFCSRQRHGFPRPPAEFIVVWAGLAQRGLGWPGRQPSLFRCNCCRLDRLRPDVPETIPS
jgi:hypothetical protein